VNARLKSILGTAWNEPRRFFGWLTLFSLVGIGGGYVIYVNDDASQRPPEWLGKIAVWIMATLLTGFALGLVGFVLAWIPPVRRMLVWGLQRRFYALGFLVALVALFYVEEDWRGKHGWDNYRREWEAKGERFDMAGVMPKPVPDEQNFALTPIVSSTYAGRLDKKGHRIHPANTNIVDRLAMSIYREGDSGDTNINFGSWQKATLTNLKPWQDFYRNPKADPEKPNQSVTNEFPVAPEPQTPAADVLLALSRYDSALEELREAAKLPYSRFPLEYDNALPVASLLPHLAQIKRVAQVLSLRAIAELDANQPEKALADLKLAFRLNDSIRNDSFLISHLVRIAVQSIVMQPVWQGLAQQKWSDAQITELENELGRQDFLADFHQAMRGERAESIATIDYLRRNRRYTDWYGVDMDESGNAKPRSPLEMLKAISFFLMPDGWFYQSELTYAQMQQRWTFPTVDLERRLVPPEANARLAAEARKAMQVDSVKNDLVGMFYLGLEKAQTKFALIQAQLDLARVACALERHRLAHGQYPETLGALAPQLIDKLPHDLINGEPLRYRRTGEGRFVLYSVGWNEKDDGGIVSLRADSGRVDINQGDWVWKYPANQKSNP